MSMAGTAAKVVDDAKEIGLREAVEAARRYMHAAYGKNLEDLQLEETEISDDDSQWWITLSFLREEPIPQGVFAAAANFYGKKVRVYKIITVDARTGEAKSMKIRKV